MFYPTIEPTELEPPTNISPRPRDPLRGRAGAADRDDWRDWWLGLPVTCGAPECGREFVLQATDAVYFYQRRRSAGHPDRGTGIAYCPICDTPTDFEHDLLRPRLLEDSLPCPI